MTQHILIASLLGGPISYFFQSGWEKAIGWPVSFQIRIKSTIEYGSSPYPTLHCNHNNNRIGLSATILSPSPIIFDQNMMGKSPESDEISEDEKIQYPTATGIVPIIKSMTTSEVSGGSQQGRRPSP